MVELREQLLRYKEITDSMISSIKEENEEKFKQLVMDKQLLINSINEASQNSIAFKEIADELRLMEQDQNLHNLIEQKKLEIKSEIKKIDDKKNATNAYNNAFRGYNFINKKI
ncbi:hypothetical protein JHL18_20130 [Clostridium sp. YIM B02505]|uniref:Flagellar protein FliT n=1 Tax=Clostridium yunnanense TaxID=2800325 RepID=A0ABS1EUB9_9CLOT|nr:flagellar protein FliT [Clostridium yunnanense]MBK1812935.1 hypothetical protein [Clostridium yunnanense]